MATTRGKGKGKEKDDKVNQVLVAVATDLNEVLQLDPAIDTTLDDKKLEKAVAANASEVYYKHPEHGTDNLKQETFDFLLDNGYLKEPEPTAEESKPEPGPKGKSGGAKSDKPAGEKKAGGFKSKPEVAERKKFIEGLIEKGKFTAKDIVAKTLEKYPEVSKSSISTIVSDSKNPKYTPFARTAVQDPESKIMSFGK